MLSRARGAGLTLRALILVTPLIATGATSAAGHTITAITVAIAATALACALVPDSHIGLLVVVLIGIQWLVTVHNPTSPWSLATAASLAIFHASLAAATVIPSAARWTRPMLRRWTRRPLLLILAAAGTWATLLLIDTVDIATNAVLVTASLLVLAVASLWAVQGSLNVNSSRQPRQ